MNQALIVTILFVCLCGIREKKNLNDETTSVKFAAEPSELCFGNFSSVSHAVSIVIVVVETTDLPLCLRKKSKKPVQRSLHGMQHPNQQTNGAPATPKTTMSKKTSKKDAEFDLKTKRTAEILDSTTVKKTMSTMLSSDQNRVLLVLRSTDQETRWA